MAEPKPSVAKAIQAHFAPALREDGFRGTGQRYWRDTGDQIQVVDVQVSRGGPLFAVNMAIQPNGVPLLSGEPVEGKALREYECLFRRRLSVDGGDQWWSFGPAQSSMDDAARDARRVYETVGRAKLTRMSAADSPLQVTTPADFASRTFDFEGFGNTGILMAWALAHARRATGRSSEAKAFAELALEEIGDGTGGSFLKPELLEFLKTV